MSRIDRGLTPQRHFVNQGRIKSRPINAMLMIWMYQSKYLVMKREAEMICSLVD